MHDLKAADIKFVEATASRGRRNPRLVMINFTTNKNGTEFQKSPISCNCSSAFKPSSVVCEDISCPYLFLTRYARRLAMKQIINVFPALAQPPAGKNSGGVFSSQHQRADSHTGVNTLAKFLDRYNLLLPVDKQSTDHHTLHSGKQTLITNALAAGLDVNAIATSTNNDPTTLQKHYAIHHEAQTKIDNNVKISKLLTGSSSSTDAPPRSSSIIRPPDSPIEHSSQSTTDSELLRRCKAERKKQKINHCSSSSSTVFPFGPGSGGGGSGGAPVFVFNIGK